ncbi:hypothetical protein LHYA1_G001159 [Lachnellula hyalina]|uniref:AB hydrolase-1 domain-containing protein n=1 Tax=Lachnellula hyalina TaxID=1316788 RepID=A0A8H8U1Q1_9HELO|nr:uncharacterized protein LHYA1_G001159 [Lachnellula hyalina]TVY30656.1 hypothetical protein LHYA1_G001159 [Lachnellula hyalina]
MYFFQILSLAIQPLFVATSAALRQNVVFQFPPDPNNETQVIQFFFGSLVNETGAAIKGTNLVSGSFIIDGTYCTPGSSHDVNVLEILVHGISYDKSVWSSLGLGNETLNWQLYAASQGYATLAIDRLGHGTNPQHPDPLNVVQGWLQLDILHQLIETIRSIPRNGLCRTFDRIVYVSHSYAGWLGTGLAAAHPKDVDAIVLTGFSVAFSNSGFESTQVVSAANMNPKRFPSFPLGYITIAQESQREALFYAGGYSHIIAEQDYAVQDTWTIGETGNLGFFVPAVNYTGPLYITAGEEDIIFCTAPGATCEDLLNSTRELFPGVTEFGFKAISDTGHTLMLHDSAPEMFAEVHDFLGKVLSN